MVYTFFKKYNHFQKMEKYGITENLQGCPPKLTKWPMSLFQ